MPAELQLDDATHRKRRFRAPIVALTPLLESGEGRPKQRIAFEDAVGSRCTISASSK